jgi:hypothetical protein
MSQRVIAAVMVLRDGGKLVPGSFLLGRGCSDVLRRAGPLFLWVSPTWYLFDLWRMVEQWQMSEGRSIWCVKQERMFGGGGHEDDYMFPSTSCA